MLMCFVVCCHKIGTPGLSDVFVEGAEKRSKDSASTQALCVPRPYESMLTYDTALQTDKRGHDRHTMWAKKWDHRHMTLIPSNRNRLKKFSLEDSLVNL